MKAAEYKKFYDKTQPEFTLMVHERILDKDGDPLHKPFLPKKDVLADARAYGWMAAGTAPEPLAAEKLEGTEVVKEEEEKVEDPLTAESNENKIKNVKDEDGKVKRTRKKSM